MGSKKNKKKQNATDQFAIPAKFTAAIGVNVANKSINWIQFFFKSF